MPTLYDVLSSIKSQVTTACNTAGITVPGQVIVGWPAATELVKILAQTGPQCQISVFGLKGARNVTRYRPEYQVIAPPTVTVTASVSGNVVTFAGTPMAGLNIHVFPDAPKPDAVYLTAGSDTTLTEIAVQVAAAISAQTGYTATPSGAAVTVTGCKTLRCNIGGSQIAIAAMEVGRVQQDVQVTVWANNPLSRNDVSAAIVQGLGQLNSMFFDLPDGTDFRIVFSHETWDDEEQSSYTAYKSHLLFTCEYGINQTVVATQVESVIASTKDDGTTTVGYSAGP